MSTLIFGMGEKPTKEALISPNSSKTKENISEQINVIVNGMTCAMCAQGIEAKLLENKFIQSISVDFEQKLVQIQCINKKKVTDIYIKNAIDWAGYDLISISR